MTKLLNIFLLLSVIFSCLNAVEVNAMFFIKGKKIPTKVEITLPLGWITKISSDNKNYGDYIYTSKKSVYMMLTISDWKNSTLQNYSKIQKQKQFIEYKVEKKSIFFKESVHTMREFYINKFIKGNQKVSLSSTIYPYKEYKNSNLDKEVKEAREILASAKIVSLIDTSDIIDPKYLILEKKMLQKYKEIEKDAKQGKEPKSSCGTLMGYKYVLKGASKEILKKADMLIANCKGKLSIKALYFNIKSKGSKSCEATKVTLQIRHIQAHLKKSNNRALWQSFLIDYKKICPSI